MALQRPIMTAEQTNVPANEEELKAATEKRLAAEKVEQAAHEAARSKQAEKKATTLSSYNAIQQGLYDQAIANGNLTEWANSVLFGSVIVALNHTTKGLEGVIEFITSEYNRIKSLEEVQEALAVAANEVPPKGELQ